MRVITTAEMLSAVLQQSCCVLSTSLPVVKCFIAAHGSGGIELETFSDIFSQATADIQAYRGDNEHTILTGGCCRCWNYL